MYKICSALNALHKHNILHLDIKPENILYGYDGRVVAEREGGGGGTQRCAAAVVIASGGDKW
jgi:serine/threonine protein kinase